MELTEREMNAAEDERFYDRMYGEGIHDLREAVDDTNNPEKVPKIGDNFVVTDVEKVAAFWVVELKRKCE